MCQGENYSQSSCLPEPVSGNLLTSVMTCSASGFSDFSARTGIDKIKRAARVDINRVFMVVFLNIDNNKHEDIILDKNQFTNTLIPKLVYYY